MLGVKDVYLQNVLQLVIRRERVIGVLSVPRLNDIRSRTYADPCRRGAVQTAREISELVGQRERAVRLRAAVCVRVLSTSLCALPALSTGVSELGRCSGAGVRGRERGRESRCAGSSLVRPSHTPRPGRADAPLHPVLAALDMNNE